MDETEVRALLIRATGDRPPGLDLMAAVRPGRQRRRVRALIPVASLGVATAVVAAVSAVVLTLPVGQPSAQAQVAAAVETTGQQSYRIHCTSDSRVFEGAFDPVRRVGVIKGIGESTETRFVGDLMYTRAKDRTTWEVAPRVEAATVSVAVAVIKLSALDPQQALQRLRSATDVREGGAASGPDWTGSRFTFSLVGTGENKPKDISGTITGAVDVDDQGRVRRLQIDFGDTGQRNVTEFSDFGVPVTVTAPPASEVEQQPTGKPHGGDPSKQATDHTKTDNAGEPDKKQVGSTP